MPTTRRDVANILARFLGDLPSKNPYEWDDFTSVRCKEPDVEAIRKEIVQIGWIYQSTKSNEWATPEGIEKLRGVLQRLRDETKTS